MNRKVEVTFPPKRIVSLVPSQTELLFDLGLDENVVGITRFCIHPKEKVSNKVKVGGTKLFDIETILQLKPDIIIGNKEENYEEGIVELEKYFPVWMSDIYTLEDAREMIKEIGALTDKQAQTEKLLQAVLPPINTPSLKYTAAYFVWRKPYMAAAANTFIDDMLRHFGVRNIFGHLTRYPELAEKEMKAVQPDFVFLSSEPYRFKEHHFAEFEQLFPTSKVVLVDGEMFSWYGSRLQWVPNYFQNLRAQLKMG